MKQIIAHYTGQDIVNLHTRAYKLDNNTIWAEVRDPKLVVGLPIMHLLPVPEILKFDHDFNAVHFQSYRKTKTGPLYLEVVQHD
jgi:hypothetical protein